MTKIQMTPNRPQISLPPDRYFDPDPRQKEYVQQLHENVATLPLICPHGHVDPRCWPTRSTPLGRRPTCSSSPTTTSSGCSTARALRWRSWASPAAMAARSNRTTARSGSASPIILPVSRHAHRPVAGRRADDVFGVEEKLTGEAPSGSTTSWPRRLAARVPPARLFERFNIEVLCTTDAATDPLAHHQALREQGWCEHIRPNLPPRRGGEPRAPRLARADRAPERSVRHRDRRLSHPTFARWKSGGRSSSSMGATATDHAALTPYTARLSRRTRPRRSSARAARPGRRRRRGALHGPHADGDGAHERRGWPGDAAASSAACATTTRAVSSASAPTRAPTFPLPTEWTRNLQPAAERLGSDPRFRLILFTLDESTYSRELAPLAGHYPALLLGPPWWFFDSVNGMRRYFDRVVETAGLYNTAGFNDDTRAFPSIPARHDVWRRVSCDWLAGLVVRGLIDLADAQEMAADMAVSNWPNERINFSS